MRIKISYFLFLFYQEDVAKKNGFERGLQENVYWKGVVTLKMIMNKVLCTYTYIHLTALQAFLTGQIENSLTKYSHYCVMGKLDLFSS